MSVHSRCTRLPDTSAFPTLEVPALTPPTELHVLLDRSQFSSSEEFRAARAATWAALIDGGATMTEIAEIVGLSRERVRQILRKEGFDSRAGMRGIPSSNNPLVVVAALRHRDCYSLRWLSLLSRYPEDVAQRMLQELGIWPAAERLWRMRSRRLADQAQQRMLDAIRAYAAKAGHPPGINDAIAGKLPFSHTTIVRRFGSWNKAITAAGLTPASRGGRGHRKPKGVG